MSRREIEEMEQIEKGLEAFLQQEMRGMDTARESGRSPQLFDMRRQQEESGDFEEEPEDLPDFSDDMEDIEDTDEEWEEETDMRKDDYIEDWDSPPRRSSGSRKSGAGRSSGGNRSNAGNRKSTGAGQSSGGNRSNAGNRKNTGTGQGSSGNRSNAGNRKSAGAGRSSGGSRSNAGNRKNTGAGQGNGGRRDGAERPQRQSARGEQRRRKKKPFRRLKRFLVTLLVIAAAGAAGLYFLVGSVYGKMTFHEIAGVAKEPLREDGVINILLIGNDSRENGEDGRSDAMILLSISSRTKQIYMTSLLRDMYVEIPGHDGNRLNAAYSYGGAELLMETIEQNLDIEVNRYVLVNFEAFANLVDAVGGVDLELTTEEIEYVNGYLVEYNMLTDRPQGTDNMDTSVSGMVHLNGPQALAYTRNRYLGTDFGRTERQRKVLSAVIKKLPLALVANPGKLFDGLLPNLTTNLTQWECYLLSFQAGKLLTYDIVQNSIPVEGSYHDATIRGMSVLEVDFEENKEFLQENIYGQGR